MNNFDNSNKNPCNHLCNAVQRMECKPRNGAVMYKDGKLLRYLEPRNGLGQYNNSMRLAGRQDMEQRLPQIRASSRPPAILRSRVKQRSKSTPPSHRKAPPEKQQNVQNLENQKQQRHQNSQNQQKLPVRSKEQLQIEQQKQKIAMQQVQLQQLQQQNQAALQQYSLLQQLYGHQPYLPHQLQPVISPLPPIIPDPQPVIVINQPPLPPQPPQPLQPTQPLTPMMLQRSLPAQPPSHLRSQRQPQPPDLQFQHPRNQQMRFTQPGIQWTHPQPQPQQFVVYPPPPSPNVINPLGGNNIVMPTPNAQLQPGLPQPPPAINYWPGYVMIPNGTNFSFGPWNPNK